jgi:PII-like signaling protein
VTRRDPERRRVAPVRIARLMILVSERVRRDRRPVHTEIVTRAREAGLADVTVLRGLDGHIGASRRSSRGLLRRPDNVPVTVLILDREERLRKFLTSLTDIAEDCIVTLDTAEAYRYGHAGSAARGRDRRDAG